MIRYDPCLLAQAKTEKLLFPIRAKEEAERLDAAGEQARPRCVYTTLPDVTTVARYMT